MKLDKYTFARLIAFIGNTYGVTVHEDVMKDIDDIIDVQVTTPAPIHTTAYADASQVDELLRLMAEGAQKIDAIKTYRHLTGKGLKDAKDAVERHWIKNDIQIKMIAKIQCQIDDMQNEHRIDNNCILNGFGIDPLKKIKEFIESF